MVDDLVFIVLAALTAAGAGALTWRDLRARRTALAPSERELLKRRSAAAAVLAVSAAAAAIIIGTGGYAAAREWALWAGLAGLGAAIALTLWIRVERRRYADHVMAALRELDKPE